MAIRYYDDDQQQIEMEGVPPPSNLGTERFYKAEIPGWDKSILVIIDGKGTRIILDNPSNYLGFINYWTLAELHKWKVVEISEKEASIGCSAFNMDLSSILSKLKDRLSKITS